MIEVARLLLAAMFAAAGLTKLADLAGSRAAIRAFGLPLRMAAPLGLMIPLAEIAIGLALIPASSARAAAVAAVALLTAYGAAIAIALLRGRKPDCHCFGRLYSAPAGVGTLLRNLALAVVAALVVLEPASKPSAVELAVAGAIAIVVLQSAVGWRLLRRHGEALKRIHELESGLAAPTAIRVGSPAPHFIVPDISGDEVRSRDLLGAGRSLLLVFVNPACEPCRSLLPRVAEWQRIHSDQLTLAVLSSGDPGENRFMSALGIRHILLQGDLDVARLYGAAATPGAVLVDAGGRVARPIAIGSAAIEQLVQTLPSEDKAADPNRLLAEPRRSESTGRAPAALAGGLGTAVAVAALTTQQAGAQGSANPDIAAEIASLNATIDAAAPAIDAASEAAQAAATSKALASRSRRRRKKKKLAIEAMATQTSQFVSLRTNVEAQTYQTGDAQAARNHVVAWLSLREQSIAAFQGVLRVPAGAPAEALVALAAAEELFRQSLNEEVTAGELLGRGS